MECWNLLIPWDDYRLFQSAELPEELWRRYRSISGSVTITRCARAIAEVSGTEFEVLSKPPS